MWYRVRNTLQSQALPCLVGKRIFSRSSAPPFLPETGQKKTSSGENPPGCRGPRPHTYLMDVAESNVTESSCMSNLKCSAHFSLSSLPSLVRVDKQTFLHIRHVAVSTNMPVLEPTHCPVKPLAGQKRSAGHFFLTEAEAKTSVSEERPPGRQGSRPANHLMVMATRNISEPLYESDLKNTAPLSLPRLPSFASRPVRVDKRTSLLGHRVDVSTKMPVLEPTRVTVKRLADPQKRCSVVVARNLMSFRVFDDEDVKLKRAQLSKGFPSLVRRFDKMLDTTAWTHFTTLTLLWIYKASTHKEDKMLKKTKKTSKKNCT